MAGSEAALTPQAAIAQAVEIAGSDDFGPAGFSEGLERSLAAFADMPLTPAARAFVHRRTVGELVTRLRIERWYADHPDVEGETIEGPVFVVGMPRTGTTATVAMLALDPRFRFLRAWEGAQPLPPPTAGEEDADPRVIAARAAAKDYDKSHIHLLDPDGPEEDLVFLSGLDMHAYHGAYPMPQDYVDWWIAEDFASTYAYHARVLKLLQSRRGPRLWLLKSPPHLFKLEAIVRRYPAAKFVMTHRDPMKIIPSVASLHCMLHEERCLPGTIDKADTGRRLLAFWAEGVRRGLAARAAIGEDRFVDVRNEDVVARPVQTFERVYAHLGLELGPELRRRISDYSGAKAPGAFGAHRYTLEEYGLAAADIRTAFSGYAERFAV
jgi:hypothetical protein